MSRCSSPPSPCRPRPAHTLRTTSVTAHRVSAQPSAPWASHPSSVGFPCLSRTVRPSPHRLRLFPLPLTALSALSSCTFCRVSSSRRQSPERPPQTTLALHRRGTALVQLPHVSHRCRAVTFCRLARRSRARAVPLPSRPRASGAYVAALPCRCLQPLILVPFRPPRAGGRLPYASYSTRSSPCRVARRPSVSPRSLSPVAALRVVIPVALPALPSRIASRASASPSFFVGVSSAASRVHVVAQSLPAFALSSVRRLWRLAAPPAPASSSFAQLFHPARGSRCALPHYRQVRPQLAVLAPRGAPYLAEFALQSSSSLSALPQRRLVPCQSTHAYFAVATRVLSRSLLSRRARTVFRTSARHWISSPSRARPAHRSVLSSLSLASRRP